jgi:hypothetical protein
MVHAKETRTQSNAVSRSLLKKTKIEHVVPLTTEPHKKAINRTGRPGSQNTTTARGARRPNQPRQHYPLPAAAAAPRRTAGTGSRL